MKVGGSLFPNAAINLINDLIDYANYNSDFRENILIINGGGEFANLIRKYDDEILLSDEIAHETAILSMDIIGKILASKIDNLIEVNTIDDALQVANNNNNNINSNNYQVPILISSNFINNNSDLKASWDISSDSIAAYIAHILGANLLIATDVDGIYKNDPNDSKITNSNDSNNELIEKISANSLASFSETSVDLMLPKMLIDYKMDCIVANGNFSDRIIDIIENCNVLCTIIYTE
ncbi:MAG: delta 1-pyrroline-5-carboxylate synthetase [Methanobacteriaceae archaeon]